MHSVVAGTTAGLPPTRRSTDRIWLRRYVNNSRGLVNAHLAVFLQGIVFANFGYRLSLWAFPHAAEIAEAGETQNFGLLDTRAAVEWLRDNVKQFGGDPTKITLGGPSTYYLLDREISN